MKYPSLIEDDEHLCYLQDGIIYCLFKKKEFVADLNFVKKAIRSRVLISGGMDRPVLIDSRPVKYWTRDSKEYSLSKEATIHIKASALIVNSDAMRISINWALKTFKQEHPSKLFTREDSALEWLKKHL
jgi:hypothetical protein